MDNGDDIGALLEFSQQQDELIEGHQKEMKQVLENNRHLRSALAQSQAQVKQQAEEIVKLRERNAYLEAENVQMRNRPQYEVGQYVERQTVERQYVTLPTRKKSRKVISNTNQLPLWDQDVSLL